MCSSTLERVSWGAQNNWSFAYLCLVRIVYYSVVDGQCKCLIVSSGREGARVDLGGSELPPLPFLPPELRSYTVYNFWQLLGWRSLYWR